ncbi:PH domain-containing protein [Deinococcus sp. YIM 134068]|uniref:PH domain-containing protein n=1 Tax=Deinococcus lichenicola TaxID=3118910 RepID=UPI002F95BDEB
MSEVVPVARAESSPALRLLMWGALLVLLAAALVPVSWEEPPPRWPLLALAAGLAVWFQLAPRRLAYTLESNALIITRLTGRTVLPYTQITARRSAGRLGIRTFGTGLPGYLTGHFTFGPDTVSRVQAAASRSAEGVVVERGGTAFFLTPADPDAFLRSLAERGVTVTA